MASAALAATTVVAALGFSRIFADGHDLVAPVAGAVIAHLVGQTSFRRNWGNALTIAVYFVGLPLLVVWLLAPDSTAYGIPTTESLSRMGDWLNGGFGRIRSAKVPVRDADELVFLSTAACWFGALSAEWVAFRAGAVLTAVVPSATVFTLTATLGTNEREALLAGAFAAAAMAFVLIHGPERPFRAGSTGPREVSRPLVRLGIPFVAVVAVAAALVGPRLPEAQSAGLVDLKDGGGPRTRFTVSPLIGIRDQLTREPPIDAFTVKAKRPAYWRLTALSTFDGNIWSSEGRARGLPGSLPSDTTAEMTRPLRQRYRISGLSQFWLPAAYRPSDVDSDDTKYIPDSLTLVTDAETASGLEYTVESLVPTYGAAELQTAPFTDSQFQSEARPLPAGVPQSIRNLAVDVTVGRGAQNTPYEVARALQDFFRTEFEYDENAPPGHSVASMEQFLFTTRAGYCEQFAAAFAVMARSLGLPTRVAVGFTPGTPEGGVYRVTSKEAHAWPEVWLHPFGWVAFEPTPARHEPSPANHTGTFSREAAPRPQPRPDPAATVTTLAPSGSAATTPTTAGGGRLGTEDEGSPWPLRLALAAAVVVAAMVTVTLTAVLLTRRDRLRRRREPDPRRAVLAAWDELVERLSDAGVGVAPSRTPAEVATAAARRRPDVADGVTAVSVLVEGAAWSAHPPEPSEVREAWTTVDAVVGTLDRDEQPRAKLVRVLRSGVAALSRTPRVPS